MARRVLPSVLLVCALALSACGGSDDDPGDAGTAPSASDTPGAGSSSTAASGGLGTASASPAPTPSSPAATPTDPESSGEVDLTRPPRTYAEALAHAAQIETAPERVDRFVTGDGTYCVLQSEYLPFSCELARGGIPAPEVCGDGPSQNVGRIEVVDGTPEPVCNTDTIREPDATTLAVGGAAMSPSGVGCWRERFGVTCVDPVAEIGFFLAPRRYEIFAAS